MTPTQQCAVEIAKSFGMYDPAHHHGRTTQVLADIETILTKQGAFAPVAASSERIAILTAHRACGNQEQDPWNGKLAGYCVVCQMPWPCDFAKERQNDSTLCWKCKKHVWMNPTVGLCEACYNSQCEPLPAASDGTTKPLLTINYPQAECRHRFFRDLDRQANKMVESDTCAICGYKKPC